MKKLIICMHVSLDGFVAGRNGEMDWIHVDEELFSYSGKITGAADTALYGRITYEIMESYWPTAGSQSAATKHDVEHSAWYNRVPKIVLSRTIQAPESLNIQIISDNLAEEIKKRKQGSGMNIVMFGSPSAGHSLMRENLIDEFWLFVNPILLGEGIPLFKGVPGRIKLKLETSKVFLSGVTGLHYLVK